MILLARRGSSSSTRRRKMAGTQIRTWILSMISLTVYFWVSAMALSDSNEAAALLAFKKKIVSGQGKLSDWQGSDPCGPPAWTGVTCVANTATNISYVTEVHLLQYNLQGTITPELGNLSNLRTLDLMWNQMTGSIPSELGNLNSLLLLLMNGNQLTGSVPPELGKLSNLNRLQLDDNNLNGSIPETLGNLTKLKHMHLNNNSFTGTIPSSIGNANSSLVHVLVDNNKLSGPLPSSLGLSPKLLIIQVDNNPIKSDIPSEWSQIPGLMKLSLRNCSLTGSIVDLASMVNLTYLDLSMNSLQDTFPTNFSSKLLTIDVSNNNLAGQLPDNIGSLQDVQSLEFSFNHFNNSIPSSLGSGASFANKSEILLVDFRNNSLSGINQQITDAATANNNVTLRLYGNPLCDDPNSVLSSQLKLKYCIDTNQTVTDSSSSNGAACESCTSPEMAVQDSSGKCRCAQPIKMTLRLKSPSFSFFDRFKAEFFNLVTSVLNLTSSQVQLVSSAWEVGPRLKVVMYLFPLNATFDDTEYQRLFGLVANWNLSAGTEWALSVVGPYELLNFAKVVSGPSKGLSTGAVAGIALGCVAGMLGVILLILFCCRRRIRKVMRPEKSFSEKSLALMPAGLKLAGVKAFTFTEVSDATNNFDKSAELGRGGYGNVYKGLLDNNTTVAVKRAERSSIQDFKQFYTEIELLSRVHHRNLVSLIGFCNDKGEQMLIYEYMPGGNLRDHLVVTEQLDYATRMRIAVGTARGILYLHTEADPPIFHRDIKASNILLDERFNAKVADFGLSKLAPSTDMSGGTPEGVSTNVRGTPGYLDPEYFMTNKLTDKSDVYSFGVVLLELITGMLPIAHGKNIVREVQEAVVAKTIWDLVDPCMGEYPQEGIESLLALALACVETNQEERPPMLELLRDLEIIMKMTVLESATPSGWSKSSLSSRSSFDKFSSSKASDKWSIHKSKPLQDDISWISTGNLLDSQSPVASIQDMPSQSMDIGPR